MEWVVNRVQLNSKKSERPVDALAVKNMNHPLTDNFKSRDASASKKDVMWDTLFYMPNDQEKEFNRQGELFSCLKVQKKKKSAKKWVAKSAGGKGGPMLIGKSHEK